MKKRKISEAALRKAILAVEAERSANPLAFQPDRAQRALLEQGRRKFDGMVDAFLKDAGLDRRRFQTLQEKLHADLERMVAQHKAKALRQAAKHRKSLRSVVMSLGSGLRNFATANDSLPFQVFWLDKPFLIWSIPFGDISDSATMNDPAYSWAKFRFATSQTSGAQRFSFYYYWVNPSSEYAVIDASTQLLANGYLKADAPWTFGVNTSSVAAYTTLNLWRGLPDQGASLQHASELVGEARALSFTLVGGETSGRAISMAAPILSSHLFVVPPGDLVVFEVALRLDYENDGGNIEADFESGDFNILCKMVEVSLLNAL
jgi:hypothetical protein